MELCHAPKDAVVLSREGVPPIQTSPALWQTARTSASTPRSHTATVIPTTGSCSSPNQSLHLRNEREREQDSLLKHSTVHTSLQLSSVNCPIVPVQSIVNCPPSTASLIWLSMKCSYSTLCFFLSTNLKKHHSYALRERRRQTSPYGPAHERSPPMGKLGITKSMINWQWRYKFPRLSSERTL